MPAQLEIELAPTVPLFAVKAGHPNVELLVKLLHGQDWQTATQVLTAWSQTASDHNKRWVRALANASGGRVAGGQRGYKLIAEMTQAEYSHWRAWMTHQADEMRRRVIKADRVWFARKAI